MSIAPATAPAPARTQDRLTLIASLLVGAGFCALWFWLLPGWLGFRVETAGAARWRWLAAIPSVLGLWWRSAAFGTSAGADTARRHRSLHRRN